ncbi:excinuclease ABC subunit UvrC [Oscillospiraceae bacterium OttesenSCG-928-F05]|nr:excinuclease ABC subunit UvrC [Oscillospiraceae bacterium OttesenSCG-928-F05]
MTEETLQKIKAKVRTLPLKPGVYIMLDKTGAVIYVGKAKQLKNRVSQYFVDAQSHSQKTRAMVSLVWDFDFIIADSEFEALVLECSLIKRHQPQYNILLKDDKGYPFIRVNLSDPFPRFTIASRVANDKARYFGPYGGRHATKKIIAALGEAFKLPDCSRKFPRDIGKDRPCLNFHMGRCLAPCNNRISEEEHRALILQAVLLLEGKYAEITAAIEDEMTEAAEKLRFEKAAALRDRYRAITLLGKRQKVVSGSLADTDVVGMFTGVKTAVAVLHFIDGALLDKDVELLDATVEDRPEEILDAYLTQYYTARNAQPRQILLPTDIENAESLARMLSERAERKVEMLTPRRGQKRELVFLATKNAKEEAERVTTRQDRNERSLLLLQKALGLAEPPRRIEAYDISNLSGTDIVASMTVFENGGKARSKYRRFQIKGTDGQDDYGSMREVIGRRVVRYQDGDEKFRPMPDLFLIDGGDVHAKTARDVLESHGMHIPVYGMVKDHRHRTRALQSPEGDEIGIAQTPQLFAFVGRIQEETHRFAIEYSRSLRKKRLEGSELDKIPGIGKTRRLALLRRFKSVKKIREADVETLSEVIPKSAAQAVYTYFHSDGETEAKDAGDSGQ